MSMITELIDRLRQHADTFAKSGFAVDGLVNDYREAADTIQLLSEKLHASQTEPCEDAISRRQAIDEIKRWFDLIKLNPDILIDSIVTLPSVQPAVCIAKISFDDQQMKEMVDEAKCEILAVQPEKVGKWIPMTVSSGRDSWKCSVCGRRARGKIKNLPYCHCGAKMEEGE